MANTFLTPDVIARVAAIELENNLVLGSLVYKDYSDEFNAKIGDTVTVRKPATFTAEEFTGSNWNAQDVTEGSVAVKLDKCPKVDIAISSKEASLDVVSLGQQVIAPAARALAQKIDEYIASSYVDFYTKVAVSGTPIIGDLANVGAELNKAKAPFDNRYLVLDPTTHSKYVTLDAVLHAEKSGSTDALRAASMGRVLGLDTYMDQNIVTSTNGTLDAGAKATGTAGATSIAITSGGSEKTIKKGSLITIASVTYTVTEDKTTATDGTATVGIYPALAANATTAAITQVAAGIQNMAFHKNAIAVVNRPLDIPLGGASGAVVNYNGWSLRVVLDYDLKTRTNLVSIDTLIGVKVLDPSLGVRLVG